MRRFFISRSTGTTPATGPTATLPGWLARGASLVALSLLAAATSCTTQKDVDFGTQTFSIEVLGVDDLDPPNAEDPLPANTGATNETWDVAVQAVDSEGNPADDFNGVVRLTVEPGAVVTVDNTDGENLGRNLRLKDGKVTARVTVTAIYGEARLWVEDIGYQPAKPGTTPACGNGKNDDPEEDVLVDFPNDPGCAYADDDTETGGTYSAGVSPAVHYSLPSIQDVQGYGSETPYPYEAININASGFHDLVVTRVSKDGFYVTDLSGQATGYNHLYAFNFSTPRGMRVCDRITLLSGTVSEFFGFTELNFPSFDIDPLYAGHEDECKVPEPPLLDDTIIDDPVAMEKLESGLVRITDVHITRKFGPKPALNNSFDEDKSNCDLNGDGKVDFNDEAEASCGNACSADSECTEWTSYISRGNYKVYKPIVVNGAEVARAIIQVQTDGAPEFNPVANRGQQIAAVTGTLRNFSGGSLNWTIEARCTDDVVCSAPGCSSEITGPKKACVELRTIGDNDAGSN